MSFSPPIATFWCLQVITLQFLKSHSVLVSVRIWHVSRYKPHYVISRVLSVNTDRPMVGIYFVRSSDLYKKLYDHTLKFLLYSTITALANSFSRSFERDKSHRLQNERKRCIFKRHRGKIKRCVFFLVSVYCNRLQNHKTKQKAMWHLDCASDQR